MHGVESSGRELKVMIRIRSIRMLAHHMAIRILQLSCSLGFQYFASSSGWQRLADLDWWNDFGSLGDGERLKQRASVHAALESILLI